MPARTKNATTRRIDQYKSRGCMTASTSHGVIQQAQQQHPATSSFLTLAASNMKRREKHWRDFQTLFLGTKHAANCCTFHPRIFTSSIGAPRVSKLYYITTSRVASSSAPPTSQWRCFNGKIVSRQVVIFSFTCVVG